MAKSDYEAEVVLKGDAKGAKKAVADTEKGFKKLTSTVKKSVAAQVAAITGVTLSVAGFVKGVKGAIDAAIEQENAVKRLETATDKLGAVGAATAESVQKFAAELQRVSTVGDEAAISTGAFLLQMGVAPGQINQAIQASADLAASLGIDLQSAARNVGKTVGGFAGELGEVIPELKDLSAESLQAGEGIAFLAEKFKGAASKEAETFAGKLKQLGNAWGDLQEQAGDAIIKNDEAVKAIDDLTKSVTEAGPGVAELAAGMVELANGYVQFLKDSGAVVRNIALWAEGTTDLAGNVKGAEIATGLLEARARELGITVEELQQRLTQASTRQHQLGVEIRDAADAATVAVDRTAALAAEQKKLKDAAEKSATAMEELGEALGIVTSSELEAEILKIDKALEKVRVTSGEWSPEFIRAQEVAEEKVESLRERIDHLRRGFGDLATEEEAATEATDGLNDSLGDFSNTVTAVNTALSLNQAFLRNTALAYDALAKKIGETAAQQAALESGLARLSQGGTRIRLAGGGSRLVNTSGTGTISYGLSPFGTGGRVAVDPDGSLRPQ